VLISGCVSFRQKGQGVVHSGQLGGLTYLSFVSLAGVLEDTLPDFTGQGLVCVCGARQLTAYPFFWYFFISVDTVIYVPSAFR